MLLDDELTRQADVLVGLGYPELGLAFLHAVPAALEKNRCFHTGASRGTDRRVPALWISDRAPHLGWCWEHNHHTWLGVASAGAARVTIAPA